MVCSVYERRDWRLTTVSVPLRLLRAQKPKAPKLMDGIPNFAKMRLAREEDSDKISSLPSVG